MVKVRGVNVFPEAVGACIAEFSQSNGEYICVIDLSAASGTESMTVMVEAIDSSVMKSDLAAALSTRLHDALGVTVEIDVVDKGALGHLTGISEVMKVRRLVDRRER